MSERFRFQPLETADTETSIRKKRQLQKKAFLAMVLVYDRKERQGERADYTDRLDFDPDLSAWVKQMRWHPFLKKIMLREDTYLILAQSTMRTERCRHIAYKTFCHHCPATCYSERLLPAVRDIMRYSGPRMFLYFPVTSIRFLRNVQKNYRRQKKAEKRQKKSTETE